MSIIEVTDGSFETDVIESNVPVLVDFWAEWCGPCKMIGPLLETIAEEYEGKITVAKMDVDSNMEMPARFGVRGIPTLIIVNNGQVAATKVGALSKSQLNEFIDGAIS